jgi:peptidoglycan/xylan/chitin deacetylase (PgdA/CDA1 family)
MHSFKSVIDFFIGSKLFYSIFGNLYLSLISPFIHSVTYHDTPEEFIETFRLQLQWYKKHYSNCDLEELKTFLFEGKWKNKKPGLIITFDDALKTNFSVALPLLEEFGFTGWFMIPPGFVDVVSKKQSDFAKKHLIEYLPKGENSRLAMSWEEIKEIERRGHIITCHSMFHNRLSTKLTHEQLYVEIIDSKKLLEINLNHSVNIFTWVGGEEWAYSNSAYKILTKANYEMIFCTNCAPIKANQNPHFLERYHIDPNYSLNRLRVVLGGLYDILYWRKRKRVFKNLNL